MKILQILQIIRNFRQLNKTTIIIKHNKKTIFFGDKLGKRKEMRNFYSRSCWYTRGNGNFYPAPPPNEALWLFLRKFRSQSKNIEHRIFSKGDKTMNAILKVSQIVHLPAPKVAIAQMRPKVERLLLRGFGE